MTRSVTKERSKVLGDLLRNMWHPGYCLISGKLKNPLATALEGFMPLGQPVKVSAGNYIFVQDGDEGNATGIVLWDKPINLPGSGTNSGVGTELYPILVRGPALVGEDNLPLEDVNGDAFTVATLVTTYAALDPPIVAQVGLDPTRTQGVD